MFFSFEIIRKSPTDCESIRVIGGTIFDQDEDVETTSTPEQNQVETVGTSENVVDTTRKFKQKSKTSDRNTEAKSEPFIFDQRMESWLNNHNLFH